MKKTQKKNAPTPAPRVQPAQSRDPLQQQTGVPVRDKNGNWSFVDPETFARDQARGSEPEERDDPQRAQRALVEKREDLGIAAPTPEDARMSAEFHAAVKKRKEEPLAEIMGRRSTFKPSTNDDEAERLLLARDDAHVPDSVVVCPRGCAWTHGTRRCLTCNEALAPVTWELLPGLINRDGLPSLGIVIGESNKILQGAQAVDDLRSRMTGEGATSRNIVLVGPTGAGKSLVAGAFLDGLLRAGGAGAERARWTSPFVLRDSGIDRALGAKTLILDDLGEEFGGADADTGLAAQRALPVAELMGALARTKGKRLVVTTFLNYNRTVKLYGGGVARRIYEGADVILFTRNDDT